MTRDGQKDGAAVFPNDMDDRHGDNHDGASEPLPKRQKRGKYVSQAWFVFYFPASLGYACALILGH